MRARRSIGRWWKEIAWGRHRRLVLVVGAAAAAVALVVAYLVVLVQRIDRIDVSLPGSRGHGTTTLIVGIDSRAGVGQSESERQEFGSIRGERADVVILVRVLDEGRPRVMTVPRDLLVLEAAGRPVGLRRLTLTWLDGPQATVDALCDSLGLGVDRLVVLDFVGFEDVIDAIGGIDIAVPDAPLRDQFSGFFVLFPGVAHLDGRNALRYVRSRHLERFVGTTKAPEWAPVPNQRGEQARAVLDQVGREINVSLLHPFRTHSVLWAATRAVRVDADAGLGGLRGLTTAIRAVPDAEEVVLPVTEGGGGIPFAQVGDGAGSALRRMGAGGSRCPARLPTARDRAEP